MLRVGYSYIHLHKSAFHTLSYITESCFVKCLSCLMNSVTRQDPHLCSQRRLKLYGLEYFTYVQTKYVKGLRTVCVEGRCWKCSADVSISQLFCKMCHSIQSPNKNANLFNVLEVDESYEVSVPVVTSKYRKLQNLLHPDRYVNKSEKEKSISEEYSSLLNKAHSTLTDPLKRAVYMLELRGVFISEDSIQSPEFLMEIMEKNEELAESKDANEVKRLGRENKLVLEKLSREVAEAFKAGDVFKAKEAVVKMKYYTSFSEKIKELKMRMGIVEE